VAKKRVGKFPKAFRQMAVDRLNQCENIVTLAKELGVSRRLLNSRETTLRKEVSQLKRVLAEKVLEVDFFKGALQQVEARRQQSGKSGVRASTPRSGS
jgi:hypothetical protein